MAFAKVWFGCFKVSNLEQLDFAAVKNVFRIRGYMQVFEMKESLSVIRRRFEASNENGYCGVVRIMDCRFLDGGD